MWIESYRSKGQRYYRVIVPGQNPVHLGSAESIFRKVRPDVFSVSVERKKKGGEPTETEAVALPEPHGTDDLV